MGRKGARARLGCVFCNIHVLGLTCEVQHHFCALWACWGIQIATSCKCYGQGGWPSSCYELYNTQSAQCEAQAQLARRGAALHAIGTMRTARHFASKSGNRLLCMQLVLSTRVGSA